MIAINLTHQISNKDRRFITTSVIALGIFPRKIIIVIPIATKIWVFLENKEIKSITLKIQIAIVMAIISNRKKENERDGGSPKIKLIVGSK